MSPGSAPYLSLEGLGAARVAELPLFQEPVGHMVHSGHCLLSPPKQTNKNKGESKKSSHL
jgi:hypothetical protein